MITCGGTPLVFAAVIALSSGSARSRAPTDEDVAERTRFLSERIVKCQSPDGSWGGGLGLTALNLMALKMAGVPNDHPAVARAVGYVTNVKENSVYAEGFVPCALELVDPVRHRRRILASFWYLAKAQCAGGGWSYRGRGGTVDNSNTQIAVLGIAAAERSGAIKNAKDRNLYESVRAKALKHFLGLQTADGGWGYRTEGRSYLSMTCAGIASLHLLGERMERPLDRCGSYTHDKRIRRGLDRLKDLLRHGFGRGHKQGGYALYALERVGVLLDLRQVGGHDWYRMGVETILNNRIHAGWHRNANDAFRLLFLAKGNLPVAIAKWRWSGDWNNDHADVANWVDVAGKKLGMNLDWWECGLTEPGSPASKASLIFLNGHGEFRASDEEVAFLRKFLVNRGTVVAEACCNSEKFAESFAEAMCSRLFPGQPAEFVPIERNHQLCSVVHKLTPGEIGGSVFRSNCRRPRLVIIKRDFSCALNGELRVASDLERARKVSTNLLAWAMLSRKPRGKLNTGNEDDGALELLTVDKAVRDSAGPRQSYCLAVGRLIHRGEWEVDGNLFVEICKELETVPGMPRFEAEVAVRPTGDELFSVPIVFMSGHEDPRLKESEYLPLRQYLQNGGFLFVSNCCTTAEFDAGVRELLRRTLPNDKLEKIPRDDPAWKVPFYLAKETPEGTKAYRDLHGREWAPLYGIRRSGRWIVIYSPIDLCCSLEGDSMPFVPAYGRKSAVHLISNILQRAFAP